jgi:hypothetical protein
MRIRRAFRYFGPMGPDETRQFAGNRGGDDIGRLAGAGEPAIPRAQPGLPLPGDLADRLGLVLLAEPQLAADPRREAVAPGRFDQQPGGGAVAGFCNAAASDASAARMGLGASE